MVACDNGCYNGDQQQQLQSLISSSLQVCAGVSTRHSVLLPVQWDIAAYYDDNVAVKPGRGHWLLIARSCAAVTLYG